MSNRQPIDLPKLTIPDGIKWSPHVQHDFVDISTWDVSINKINLDGYLKRPGELAAVLKEVPYIMEELIQGKSAWQRYMRFPAKPYRYHVMIGLWKPMSMSPWDCVEHGDDYLTFYAHESKPTHEQVGIRHYISLEKHEAEMQALRDEITQLRGESPAQGGEG
jgi:hypothetical protein